jgi:two-component system LytT family sensor kinase
LSELLNLVGLSTGVALYAMLLVMVVRSGRVPGIKRGSDAMLLVTAVLGLVWNLCALPAYELTKVGIAGPFPWLVALGFCALGFLPAVAVHSVLRAGPQGVRGVVKKSLAVAAYAASGVAAALHVHAVAVGDAVPSAVAMRLLTYTFVALVVPLAVVTRRQPGARRALWLSALAAFAITALHLSGLHLGERSWPIELLGHHASLPLAFAILYQDFPFALADLFLKRALALLLLVVTAFVAIAMFSLGSSAFERFALADPRQVGALVTLWVATALVYPTLRRATAWFVDSVVLRRPDYRSLRASAARRVQTHDAVAPLMAEVCELLAPALSARSVRWYDLPAAVEQTAGGNLLIVGEPSVAIVPTAELPRYAVEISQLTGGRRLLSDDLSMLEAVAVIVARRIDAIRVTKERHDREMREQEVAKLASEAELRALRAQINPHFLFNALTTIGYLIQTAPSRALDTLMKLTALLRGVLRSEGEFTTLGRELEIVESYLDIERARFEDRLQVEIDVPPSLRSLRIPPLVLQPLVENAIKHGIGRLAAGGAVRVAARLEPDSDGTMRLSLTVGDTGAGSTRSEFERQREAGVGLRNVEKRLASQYGPAAALTFETAPGGGTSVTLRIPAEAADREPAATAI